MTKFDEATQRQVDATLPGQSVWLSANAGSGKTRVLTDRVARLLLQGTEPQNILCLTFTKAAASEMQNRLYQRLGAWAMMPGNELRAALSQLGVDGPLPDDRLAHARTLFAAAIETPGGLRIQTIHSFCAALLRRFPLEAGISPVFRELDDRNAIALRQEVLRSMASGDGRTIFETFTGILNETAFDRSITEITNNRLAYDPAPSEEDIRTRFNLPATSTLDADIARFWGNQRIDMIHRFIKLLEEEGSGAQQLALLDTLKSLNFEKPGLNDILLLGSRFVFANGAKEGQAKVDALCNKDMRAAHRALFDEVNDTALIVADLLPMVRAEQAASATKVMYDFATAYLSTYADAKAHKGWLDFDDLIIKARDLLADPAVAAWVLFRLDGGIDHILVDEAQDTSPTQWDIVRLLASDFDNDASDTRARTLFVVGDKKQSIYSFQGADPDEFDRMRAFFDGKLRSLNERELLHSFRSSPAILTAVDAVFKFCPEGGFDPVEHRAFHAELPGRVDLWSSLPATEKQDPPEWNDPTPPPPRDNHFAMLADQVADTIAHLLDYESIPGKDGTFRPVEAGDILVLTQRRKELFHGIIRACKMRNLPIAGADRLRVGAELAVRDLRALLSFLALPQDNLSLATALRSPLFGISEDQLFDLAHNRTGLLWDALETHSADFPIIHGQLVKLMRHVDFLPPYELLEHILTIMGGRLRLLARLGPEAEEGIDELLNIARDYEVGQPASLTGFLAWLELEDTEIKRQAELGGTRIRIMTTHGAKGLESPVVILPETHLQGASSQQGPEREADRTPYWRPIKANETKMQAAARESSEARAREERQRLLYVAMTRAERWLIICGAGKETLKEDSWYQMAKRGLDTLPTTEIDGPTGPTQRFEQGDWPKPSARDDAAASIVVPEGLDDPLLLPPDPPIRTPKPLTPSEAPGPKALPGELDKTLSPERAMARGTALHRLLEQGRDLREDRSGATLESLLELGTTDLDEVDRADVLRQAQNVLGSPDFDLLFAADALAEVGVSIPIAAAAHNRLYGVIDRLIIGPDHILIVDFKSNQLVPATVEETPVGVLQQMAAYAFAISQLYPNHSIETAILWTSAPRLDHLPHNLVMRHLGDIAPA